MKVKDFVRQNFKVVFPDDEVLSIVKLMKDNDVGFVLVMDSNKVVGVLTARDIVFGLANGMYMNEVAFKIMSAPVRSVSEDDDVGLAISMMREFKCRRLVLTNVRGEVAGVVSIDDLVMNDDVNGARKVLGEFFVNPGLDVDDFPL